MSDAAIKPRATCAYEVLWPNVEPKDWRPCDEQAVQQLCGSAVVRLLRQGIVAEVTSNTGARVRRRET